MTIRNNPTNTIYDVKRFLGLPYEQCKQIIDHEHYGFRCIPYNRSLVYEITCGNEHKFKTPELVDADFLEYLVRMAERYLGYKVEGAVITIPAFFQYSQMNATLRAAEAAKLNVFCVVYEPNAAAIAINPIPGVDKRHILVFDLGGGTFDVAVIKVELHDYTIIGNGGHPFLGGRDFDQVIVDIILQKLKPFCDTKCWKARQFARLRTYAEEVKIELSKTKIVELDLSSVDEDLDVSIYISRKQFEDGIRKFVQEAINICDATLIRSGVSLGKNDCILLVGGSSKIPLVREELTKKYGNILERNNNPDEDVAKGACMVALDRYCSTRQPPIPNPCTPIVLHTFVMRAVGVSFGNSKDIQTVLPVGTPCNQESKAISHQFFMNMRITVYCKDSVNSSQNSTEWRQLETFNVHGIMGKAYVCLTLNEMGRLRYRIGIEGQPPKIVNTIEIAKEDTNTVTTFNKRWIVVKKGIDTLNSDIASVRAYNTPVKEQLIHNLEKAIAFLNDENALRVSSENIQQYVEQNHNLVKQYVPTIALHVFNKHNNFEFSYRMLLFPLETCSSTLC